MKVRPRRARVNRENRTFDARPSKLAARLAVGARCLAECAGELRARPDPELAVDLREVRFDRAATHEQRLRDLAVGGAADGELRERSRVGGPPGGRAPRPATAQV